MLRMASLALVGSLLVAACVPRPDEPGGPTVVATTSILGDIVSNVAAPGTAVVVLIPPGTDPHEFRPSAAQVAAISSADLVVANGGGLEEGLVDVLEAARRDGARVLEVLPEVGPLMRAGHPDPHFWLDPLRAAEAARVIAAELGTAGSESVEAYLRALETTHSEIEDLLSRHEADARKLVTSHDALGYFADRYGFEVVGIIVPGGSTLGDPSSSDLARIVDVIVEYSVPAIFVDFAHPGLLARAIAAEVDRPVEVVELYTGTLGGPGSGAETLIDMLLLDARRISAALEG